MSYLLCHQALLSIVWQQPQAPPISLTRLTPCSYHAPSTPRSKQGLFQIDQIASPSLVSRVNLEDFKAADPQAEVDAGLPNFFEETLNSILYRSMARAPLKEASYFILGECA